jgi:hypothetical protein
MWRLSPAHPMAKPTASPASTKSSRRTCGSGRCEARCRGGPRRASTHPSENQVAGVAAVAPAGERVACGDDERDKAVVAARRVPCDAFDVGEREVAQARETLLDRVPARHGARLAERRSVTEPRRCVTRWRRCAPRPYQARNVRLRLACRAADQPPGFRTGLLIERACAAHRRAADPTLILSFRWSRTFVIEALS